MPLSGNNSSLVDNSKNNFYGTPPVQINYQSTAWKIQAMYLILCPIVFLIGIGGNLLATIVLRSKSFRKVPSSRVLVALAIVDSLVLLVGVLRVFTTSVSEKEIRNVNTGLCKLQPFLEFWMTHSSAWLLVLVTGMRALSLISPLKVKAWITHRVEWISIIIVLLVTFASNSYVLFGMKLESKTKTIRVCHDGWNKGLSEARELFDQIFGSFIPFAFILTGNLIILSLMLRSRRTQQNLTQGSINKDQNKIKSTTIMLLTVSFAFLVTTAPLLVFSREFNNIQARIGPDNTGLLWNSFQILFYSNYILNFYLYCASGKAFRLALIKILSPESTRKFSNGSHGQTQNCTVTSRGI
ncbi:unnamed protein product [Dimorphilus gyrociliatus]|uniref:G-protein coupled receptors family 1 profile domain-containing protein n=1 Tax=Dimorphilus gyrociliatus TaxID=2664684 RepID=A0A7I8W988_9ANNE|nr:unnamed protein product [Dimorphilus gyrociliatus]